MSKFSGLTVMLLLTAIFTGVVLGLLVSGSIPDTVVELSAYDRMVLEETKASTGKLNINKATADELSVLPDIGSELAKRIVAYRQEYGPYISIDELKNVDGIGDKRLENIRKYITVGG